MKPAEVHWRFLQAERRALDGPGFNSSPAILLARTLDRMRKLLIHNDAIDYCQERIRELLPLVSMPELRKALTKLERADFGTESAEGVVLEAYSSSLRSPGKP